MTRAIIIKTSIGKYCDSIILYRSELSAQFLPGNGFIWRILQEESLVVLSVAKDLLTLVSNLIQEVLRYAQDDRFSHNLSCYSLMVPKVGLEPTRLAPPPPQDGVSTNSTTSAYLLEPIYIPTVLAKSLILAQTNPMYIGLYYFPFLLLSTGTGTLDSGTVVC